MSLENLFEQEINKNDMYFHKYILMYMYNQTENTWFFAKYDDSALFGGIYNLFFVFLDEIFFFWWTVLDIARTSFKGIQNFKFQLFQNSLHPNVRG